VTKRKILLFFFLISLASGGRDEGESVSSAWKGKGGNGGFWTHKSIPPFWGGGDKPKRKCYTKKKRFPGKLCAANHLERRERKKGRRNPLKTCIPSRQEKLGAKGNTPEEISVTVGHR